MCMEENVLSRDLFFLYVHDGPNNHIVIKKFKQKDAGQKLNAIMFQIRIHYLSNNWINAPAKIWSKNSLKKLSKL